LACMIWGYGGDREARYGPSRTAQMMTSEGFNVVLKETSDLIRSGKISEAYDRFDSGKIMQCGPAFFTKYFYFLGRGVGHDSYPLILDRRVAKALGQLLGNENLTRFVSLNRRTDQILIDRGREQRDKYLHYLGLMWKWAKQLGCKSDDIECFLYKGLEHNV